MINVGVGSFSPSGVRSQNEGAGPVEAKGQGKQSGWTGRTGQPPPQFPVSFVARGRGEAQCRSAAEMFACLSRDEFAHSSCSRPVSSAASVSSR